MSISIAEHTCSFWFEGERFRPGLSHKEFPTLQFCTVLPERDNCAAFLLCSSLPKEAQACLAGNMQRVAKLIAVKADYEVIRELSKLEDPEHADHDWDER